MSQTPPDRLADAPDTPELLRGLLRGARDDAPSPEQFDRMARGISSRIGPPPTPAARPWWVKGVGLAAVVTALSLGALRNRPPPVRPTAPAVVAHAAPAPLPPLVARPSPALRTPEPAPAPPPPDPSALVRAPEPPARPLDSRSYAPEPCVPEAHQARVDHAHDLLRQRDARASLRLLDRDERACPTGDFAEERARVRIEALMQLRRRDEASRAFSRFQRAWPASPYERALRALFDGGAQ